MRAIAIFQRNAYEINAAQNKLLDGDIVEIPEEINKTEDYLFCIQDVSRAWVLDESSIMLIFNDGDAQRIMYELKIWESIENAMALKDKGFVG